MIDTELYKKEEISVFFDIGTNGELVIGNKEFLLCGAGAAGPALEGGVVSTGMRADTGAVDEVKIRDGKILVHVIENEDGEFQKMDSGNKSDKQEALKNGGKPLQIEAKGICGSGIIDLIAELFLEGWIDIRGKFSPGEKSADPEKRRGSGAWSMRLACIFTRRILTNLSVPNLLRTPWWKSCFGNPGWNLTRQNGSMWQGLLESMYQGVCHFHRHVSGYGPGPHYKCRKLFPGRSGKAAFEPGTS